MGALEHKFALVTGGNRGIGLEVCRKLVEKGKPVILTSRDAAAGAKAVQDLSAFKKADIRCIQVDTANQSSIDQLATKVKTEYDGKIDVLINNAGILHREWDKAILDSTIKTNYDGPVNITYQLLPHLAQGALVIMVSSQLGQYTNLTSDYANPIKAATTLDQIRAAGVFQAGSPQPQQNSYSPSYNVSKCMLNRAVQLMHEDQQLRDKGVTVVSTCPGWCRTGMGSERAHRSAEQGAGSVVWPWLHWQQGLAGGFFRDGQRLPW
eukprot:jgi/Chrzof1/7908/Cz02g40230.t1